MKVRTKLTLSFLSVVMILAAAGGICILQGRGFLYGAGPKVNHQGGNPLAEIANLL